MGQRVRRASGPASKPCAAALLVALGLAVCLAGWSAASAQDGPGAQEPPEVLFVIDLSGSMDDLVADGHKLTLAISAIDETYQDLIEQGADVGVIGYAGDCMLWPPQSVPAIPQASDIDWPAQSPHLRAGGRTPTDLALLYALYRMQIIDSSMNATGREAGTIILISDGQSNGCTDPCSVAQQHGAGRITVHSVGFDLAVGSPAAEELSCIANQTGGVAITVNDYEQLKERIAEIARLRVSLRIEEVQDEGASLRVQMSLTSNIALADPYLRIDGPAQLLNSSRIRLPLADLATADTQHLEFRWSAAACDSLAEIVEFHVGGTRVNGAPEDEGAVEQLAAISSVEDILLQSMTYRELRGRCTDSLSAADTNLLRAEPRQPTSSNGPSNLITYGGAGIVSLLAGIAAKRRQTNRSPQQNSAARHIRTGQNIYNIPSRALTTWTQISANPAVKKADELVNLTYKNKIPVLSSAVAITLCAVEDPSAGCIVCAGAVVAASTATGGAAAATTAGILAVPAAIAAGAGMQYLWDAGLYDLIDAGADHLWNGARTAATSAKDALTGVAKRLIPGW